MFDLFPNTLEFPCLVHPSQNCTHLCLETHCSTHPYLCSLCLNDVRNSEHYNHQDNIVPLHEAVHALAEQIDQKKTEVDKINQKVFNKVDMNSLLKKLEDSNQTLRTLDHHLKGIKSQIERQTDQLLVQFQRRLLTNKQNLFQQIDNYQKTYAQNFQTYQQILQPLTAFKKNIKYFSNSNNIFLKMHSQLKRKSSDWFLSLKKLMNQLFKLSSQKSSSLTQNITKAIQTINSPDDLPYMKSIQISQSTKLRIQYLINQTINDKLSLKDMKTATDANMQQQIRGSNNHNRIQKRFY